MRYSIASTIGFINGKSAVRIQWAMGNKRLKGLRFWSTEYCVNTVGHDVF
jgi:hypothetical protein